MKVLVCNAGSTSLKLKLYDMDDESLLVESRMERIGEDREGRFIFRSRGTSSEEYIKIGSYDEGLGHFLGRLDPALRNGIDAVGFKTVLSKGFPGDYVIDEAVKKGMHDYMSVAPVHNTCYLQVIEAFERIMPDVVRVGTFETAFHQTLEEEAYVYPLPYEWKDKYGVRRFGYHGASHYYQSLRLNELLGERYRAVSCHLGGSSSLAAIVDGTCRETSFGLSLQTGVPQGSRIGDIDPFVIFYLLENTGYSEEKLKKILEKESGLKGISGVSGDMRDIEKEANSGNERAMLAMKIYSREIARYIGGYAALMGGLDAITFTAGVGENSSTIRKMVTDHFSYMGLELDEKKNLENDMCISSPDSAIKVFVIPADEEIVVARRTVKVLAGD
ncbi:MAG: acetate/propionate family kinase [Clostridia bacterium]|nr:acetate/propionate family kinase [Clostridia bacterium]